MPFFENRLVYDNCACRIGKGTHFAMERLTRFMAEYYKKHGLPIGNQTSQWFALYYLDPMDRIIKEKMHIKYYVRYMDDGILIHESKEVLNRTRRRMEAPSS